MTVGSLSHLRHSEFFAHYHTMGHLSSGWWKSGRHLDDWHDLPEGPIFGWFGGLAIYQKFRVV